MITRSVLNAILHCVGMLWIICSNEEILYEMDEINHPDWLNKGPWYSTSICSRLRGSLFEYFIRLCPAQDVPFFYIPSHLSELQSCKSIMSTNFPFILIFK